jgi:NAD(P)-dependent dehydrogenase (short-subunit alcohol dehydrogenase family)
MAQSKSVVITGATGGVGARLVDRFLREGWRVFAAARRPGAIGRDGVGGRPTRSQELRQRSRCRGGNHRATRAAWPRRTYQL